MFIQVKEIVAGVFGLVCKEKVSQVSPHPTPSTLNTYGVSVRRCPKHVCTRFVRVTSRTAVQRFSEYFLGVWY